MALAHLSSTLPTVQQGKTKLHAFIVDHKARSGSSHEAQYVAETMNELKIKPHILTIDWDGKFPRSAFETIARERRYQLMARQCVQHDINRLLLGHHEDDRAETVLYRMLLFAKGEGLATMKARTKMPGTWEVFGADDLELGRPFASTPKVHLLPLSTPLYEC